MKSIKNLFLASFAMLPMHSLADYSHCDEVMINQFLHEFFLDEKFRIAHSVDAIQYTEYYIGEKREFNTILTIVQIEDRGLPLPLQANGDYMQMITDDDAGCTIYVQSGKPTSHLIDYIYRLEGQTIKLVKITADIY